MKKPPLAPATALLLGLSLMATSCGTDGAGAAVDPSNDSVEMVVHTGPGGGSDVFARATAQMLSEGEITSRDWMVQNVEGGSGAQAMAHMARQGGNDDVIAAVTMTWLSTPLTVGEGMIRLDELTPIAQVLTEPTFLAVPGESPFDEVQELIEASNNGEQLTHVGGSPTAHASLVGDMVQKETGAQWRFLSFSGGGERMSALLGGDADLMLGSLEDFEQHVRSGDLRLLAVAEDERLESHPDVPTLKESGVDISPPDQVRGFVGPPDMDPESVALYEDLFRELSESQAWQDYLIDNGWVDGFAPAEEWGANISALEEELTVLIDEFELAES